jgi:hypothetical protein
LRQRARALSVTKPEAKMPLKRVAFNAGEHLPLLLSAHAATPAFNNFVSAEHFKNHISTAEAPLIDRDQ